MEREKQKGSVPHDASPVAGQHQGNPIESVEMIGGPEREYGWVARVSRDPTPQGLDGGRVQYFNLYKFNDAPREEAPGFDDMEKYQKWLMDLPPRFIHIAQYKDGKLTLDIPDPNVGSIIEEIKECFSDKTLAWERALEKSARQEPERDPDRNLDRDR